MATKTIGTAVGRDYPNLTQWASYVNTLALTGPELAEVYNDGPITEPGTVAIGGWTGGSPTNTVTLRVAAGQRLTTASPLRWNATNGAATSSGSGSGAGAYQFNGSDLIVEGLQFKTASATNVIRTATGTNQVFKNCLIYAQGVSGVYVSSNNPSFDNCVILVNGTGSGINIEGSSATMTGCVVAKSGAASGSGILHGFGGSPPIKNTAVIGFTNDFVDVFSATSTNNATDKSVFGGTNAGGSGQVNLTSADFISLTAGSEDLRVASSSTKLINTGATAGLATDFYGTARPQGAAYDIGAMEYAAPASTLSGGITLDDVAASGTISSIASSLAGSITLDDITASGALGLAPSTITTPTLKNNTGTVLASLSGVVANVYNATTGALVVRKTGLTSSGAGIVTITDAALSAGTSYAYEIDLSASTLGRRLPVGVAA